MERYLVINISWEDIVSNAKYSAQQITKVLIDPLETTGSREGQDKGATTQTGLSRTLNACH